MPDGAHHIIDCNPAHPLVAMPLMPAQSQTKWRQKLGQGAALRTEYHSKSGVNHPDASLTGRFGRRFPFEAHSDKKVLLRVSRSARFGQQFVPPVAVDADGGCRNQNLRWGLESAQSLAQQAGTQRSALLDAAFS